MSPLALRATAVPRSGDPPHIPAGTCYFVLGRNARGLWVVRESTGRKGGLFVSREAALRFARLEGSAERPAVLYVSDLLEFDYAA